MSRIAYVNGRYLPHRDASVHIEDRGYQFSDGVYEVCEVRERLAKLDIEPSYASGDVLENKLQSEIANWTRFIDAKGIKAE